MSISGALRGKGSGSRWTGANKRRAGQEAREVEGSSKRQMPQYRTIIRGIVKAFATLGARHYDREIG